MMHLQKKQDVIANNLANGNTTGFKMAKLISQTEVTIGRNAEYLLHQDEKQSLDEVHISHEKGPIVQTDNPLDFAIHGDGFFSIETEQGPRYTRNGSFSVDSEGMLTTLNGNYVLMDNGDRIDVNNDKLAIMNDGGIFLEDFKVGNLGIVEFEQKEFLIPRGSNLFENVNEGQNTPQASAESRVKKGFLEGSNVNTVAQMVEMISKFRNYEASQKTLHAIDDTLGKAVNDVGRVQ